jgi:lysophospholipase L1-like esterase
LAAVGLASVVVIMACVHPRTRLLSKTILSQQPLPWIGIRSYGIYLWHWPVYMLSRAHLDVALDGLPLLGLRLVLTVVLAEISYRYVERPIRKGALERGWGRIREARGQGRWRLYALWGGAATALVVMCGVVGVAVASAKSPHPPSYLSTKRLRVEASQAASGADKIAQNAVPQSAAARGGAASAARTTSRETRTGARRTAAKASGKAAATGTSARAPTVSAVGDSVMLGAVDQLQREIPNLTTIDARGSRQAPEAIGVLRQLRASGQLGDVVIVHIGNNGIFTAGEFDEMMRVLKGVHKVLVVNVTIPDGYSWVPNNKVLAAGVERYPNRAVLVDWYDASAGHPEYFWDGLHLTPQGARAYADLIATVYKKHAR